MLVFLLLCGFFAGSLVVGVAILCRIFEKLGHNIEIGS